MPKILTKAKEKYVSIRGYHTDRHLVLIESDDWGSIRMPSRKTFLKLQELGDSPEKDAFLSNDSLENEKDLLELFKVLNSVHDCKGSPAIITANFAMANPDFDKIDYKKGQYYYEPFYETYDKYYPNNQILDVIKSGIKQGVFFPQLHCREHMNVNRWLLDLKNGKEDTILSFENRMIGIGKSFSEDNVFGYMDAFNTMYTSAEELAIILNDAKNMFEQVFGYKTATFVASCFVWEKFLEKILLQEKILGIQSGLWQYIPCGNTDEYKLKRKLHFTGECNKDGQVYTVRNCSYEPAYLQNVEESVNKCLEEVRKSFKDRKPAIINSHRFNYISRINPENALANLQGLQKLLNAIRNEYNDVEFISTPELVNLLSQR